VNKTTTLWQKKRIPTRRNGGDSIKFNVVGAMLIVMKGTHTYAIELIDLHSALD
jgi:hypothetical protein